VTDRVLSEERRNELAALLDDEGRLTAEYPKVADYLDMAARLPGTGDARADAAFDLRLVHYLVGGNVDTTNPYWDVVAPAVSVRDGRRVVDGGRPDGSPRLAYAQLLLQSVYAYAIPSRETIDWVAAFCAGRPVVEPGAGRGYWAAQLTRAGIEVEAYDAEPPDQKENGSFPRAAGQRDVWHPVRETGNITAEHVLLLCWPPGWGNPMAADALAAFEAAGGERLILIGEPRGGMNATDAFFDALTGGWRLASADPDFVSWWNLSDVAQAWVR
jgi:hypothetical protein